jgi:hypothetical protein
MTQLSPNLPTPGDVATLLATRLRQTGRQFFVDAGCGSGELLLAIARACPSVRCHGLELSPTLSAGLRATIQAAALPNATVHEADLRYVLDVVPEADFVFAYVGGAMHQALALHLAARGYQGTLLSALYPCYPLPVTLAHSHGSLPAFEYEFPACSTQVLWDAAVSVALAPAPGYALLSRAATFYKSGALSVHVQAPAALRDCVAVHLGQPIAVPGQTLLIDIIVDTTQLARPLPPSVVSIGLACNGAVLEPAHTLLLGYHPTTVVELALPEPAGGALVHNVRTQDFTTFYAQLAAYEQGAPAVLQQLELS